jgi:hypothetical protein
MNITNHDYIKGFTSNISIKILKCCDQFINLLPLNSKVMIMNMIMNLYGLIMNQCIKYIQMNTLKSCT